jgi:D-tyrosyl-tRNA(Tyr) deacylase
VRLLLQRVSRAQVRIDNEVSGQIDKGILVFVGLGTTDTDAMFGPALEKIANMRIFPDDEGKMNKSVLDVGGGLLVVSQFTLYADTRKGRRPSYIKAMPPGDAEPMFNRFFEFVKAKFSGPVGGGRFGAMMDVDLVNDGPVTIWIDSDELPWGNKG